MIIAPETHDDDPFCKTPKGKEGSCLIISACRPDYNQGWKGRDHSVSAYETILISNSKELTGLNIAKLSPSSSFSWAVLVLFSTDPSSRPAGRQAGRPE